MLKATCQDCEFTSTVVELFDHHSDITGHTLEFEEITKSDLELL